MNRYLPNNFDDMSLLDVVHNVVHGDLADGFPNKDGSIVVGFMNEFGVKVRRDSDFYHFKYNQIKADFNKRFVRESRGSIINMNNCSYMCRPYDKFFNIGEPLAVKVDDEFMKNAVVTEKLDGTLINLFYNYRTSFWTFSTTGTSDASGQVGDLAQTFESLAAEAWENMKYSLSDLLKYKDLTFMFELCSPFNRVVVAHDKTTLVLHGVRENRTGKLLDPMSFSDIFDVAPGYSFDNYLKLVDHVYSLDGFKSEGVVIRNGNDMVKMKSPDYVLKHRFKFGTSVLDMIKIVVSGETEEVIATHPEFETKLLEINRVKNNVEETLEKAYFNAATISSDKDFALFVRKNIPNDLSGWMFQHRKSGISVSDWLSKTSDNRLKNIFREVY